MKKVLLSLFLLLACLSLSAQENLVIAVYPFENTSGNEKFQWLGTGIMNTLMTNLSQFESIIIVDRSSMEKLLKEQKLALSGLTAEDEIAIGEFLQADTIISGDFLILGELIQINARAVDIESNKIVASTDKKGSIDSDLFSLIEEISANLLQRSGKSNITDQLVKPSVETLKNYTLAEEAYYRRNFSEAVQYISQVLSEQQDYIPGLVLSSMISFELEDLESAKSSLRTAMEEIRNQNAGPQLFTDVLFWMSHLNGKIGEYEDAVKNAQTALDILREAGLGLSPKALWGMAILGDAWLFAGNYEQAEQVFRDSLSARIKVYGNTHIETAGGYNDLGMVFMRCGRFEEAAGMFDKAIKVYENLESDPSRELSFTLFDYGMAMKETGNLDEAKSAFARILQNKNLIEKDDMHWRIWGELSDISLREDNLQDALMHAKKQLMLYMRTPSPGPREILDMNLNLGIMSQQSGSRQAAAGYITEAEKAYKGISNLNPKEEMDMINILGVGFLDSGFPAKAVQYLEKSLELRKNSPETDREALAWNYLDLGSAYRENNADGWEQKCFQSFLAGADIFADLRGIKDQETLNFYITAGFTAADTGLKEEAVQIFKKIIPHIEDLYGRGSSEARELYDITADLLNGLNRKDEAEEYRNR